MKNTDLKEQEMRKNEFEINLGKLLVKIATKAKAQYDYSEQTNIPKGILKPSEVVEHAIQHGIAEGLNSYHDFDCNKAIEYAIAILEASNCHAEVRALVAATEIR